MDLTATIAPKSDQRNADDFALTGPRTFTITDDVEYQSPEQPFGLVLDGDIAHPYKPGKSMRRVLVAAWGKESSAYIGRSLTLFTDPSIKFGGQETGGIRISHMSHISKTLKLALTVTKGKKSPFIVEPLTDMPPTPKGKPLDQRITDMLGAFAAVGITVDQIERRIGGARDSWTEAVVASMLTVYSALKSGADKDELFPVQGDPTFPNEPTLDGE